MDEQRNRSGRAGGAIIAGAIFAGVIGGSILGQPSIGFLGGAGTGALMALLLWWRDRR